jgi:TPR repeat protein
MRGFLSCLVRLVAVACAVIFAMAASAYAEGKRVALVVGNSAYQSVAALPNPRNDAEAVSTALRKQGFEVVTALDLSRIELERAVERYARSLNGAEISLFYYSGHGIEVGGENRIIPVDASLNAPEDLETQTYSLQTIMLLMQGNSKAQLIYMDACRNNPFTTKKFFVGLEENERQAGKGLAEQKGSIGSLIAYAAAPGEEAQDGNGANSPFTTSVMKHSFTQGLDVQNALMKVTEEVWEATMQSQRPWINSTLVKPVFLNNVFASKIANLPDVKESYAALQANAAVQDIATGPYVVGVGAQPVFAGEALANLPPADGYKLLQLPQSGTLSINGQPLAEGTLLDTQAFQQLAFEPSTDTASPAATLSIALASKTSKATPANVQLPVILDDCDLLAGEPLDMQGIGKGIDLEDIIAPQAIDVCVTAAARYAQSPRFIYQLGRAKLAGGEADEALRLFQLAADAGHIRAYNQLGDMAMKGLGRAKSEADANAFFKLAADKGDAAGLLSYGRNLAKGVGLKADPKEAIALLKRSAEMGNTDALDEMGALYLYGGAVKANAKRAVKFYEASVTRGVKKPRRQRGTAFGGRPDAPTDIGRIYFNGQGVAKDLRQAIKWYELGASRGNQGGVGDLSWIFAQGPDGFRDPTRAVWYTSLALGSDGLRDNAELLRRLASLPDEAKRDAMRDFVGLLGACSTQTAEGLDDTLLLMANKTWLRRQQDEGDLSMPEDDGSFAGPDGKTPADELRYWNLVNADGEAQALMAYLKHFPDGIFADIARSRAGGLIEQPKLEAQACIAPVPVVPKAKKRTPKVELVKPRQDPPPVVKKPRPIAPVVQKPKRPVIVEKPKRAVVVEKPKRTPKPPVKRPKRPRVIVHDEEPVFEEDEPEVEIPRRRIRLRLPRFPRPQEEDVPQRGQGCEGIC